MSDFDLMMARKKDERRKRGRRKDVDIINDNDDLIAHLMQQMRVAAEVGIKYMLGVISISKVFSTRMTETLTKPESPP